MGATSQAEVSSSALTKSDAAAESSALADAESEAEMPTATKQALTEATLRNASANRA